MAVQVQSLGELIAERRKARDLKLREVCALADVSKRALIRWEQGDDVPRLPAAARLCRVLGIRGEELLRAAEVSDD